MTVLGRGEILAEASSEVSLQLEDVDLSNAYLVKADLGPAKQRGSSPKRR
jgi:hypothetical protein